MAAAGAQKKSGSAVEMTSTTIALSEIRRNGGTQSRAELDENAIVDYAAAYESQPARMPAVVVFYDGTTYWLADGFHRVRAAERAGLSDIAVEIRQGSRRSAILYSVGANAAHGLRRTNADKRRAVLLLLDDDEWSQRSDRWIAEQCGVSDRFVNGLRDEVRTVRTCDVATGEVVEAEPETRTGKDGKRYPTSRIVPPAGSRPRRVDPNDALTRMTYNLPAYVDVFAMIDPAKVDPAKWPELRDALQRTLHEILDALENVDDAITQREACDPAEPAVAS